MLAVQKYLHKEENIVQANSREEALKIHEEYGFNPCKVTITCEKCIQIKENEI